MSTPRPLQSSPSPSPMGIYSDDVQISPACENLRSVLGYLSAHIEDNRNLRIINAKLNGKTASRPPDYSNTESEAIALLFEINNVTNNDGDEKGLKKNDFLEKLKKSFEEIDRLAAEFIAQNEKLRESNDSLDPNGGQQFEQARRNLGKRKEEGEERYQEDRNGDETYSSPEEESEETYKEVCSLHVRASDTLHCLLENLEGKIQEYQELRKTNTELNGDSSPSPPDDKYEEAEAAAEEAKQLIMESKSRVSRNAEQQGLIKLLRQLVKKRKEISSLNEDLIRDSKVLKETNRLLKIHGVQKFELKSYIKEVGRAPKSAPRDQNSDDDLREQIRVLQGRLQAMEAATRDAGKTLKELENVRAELVAANVSISQLKKAATESSQHHLPCPLESDLKDVRAALVAANVRIGELEKEVAEEPTPHIPSRLSTLSLPPPKLKKITVDSPAKLVEAATASSQHHQPCPLEPELKDVRSALVAANVRVGKLEKQVAEEPTPRIPSRPSTPPPPAPKLKRNTVASSAELVAANERIVELEKQLAVAIAKATEVRVGKSHASPDPKPEENVGSSSPTSGPAARLPLVSKAAVDPVATDNPPSLDILSPTQLFVKRANLPSDSQDVKQQVKSIDSSSRPPKHPSSAPPTSPPNDPPPSFAAEPLRLPRPAAEWLGWLIWFFVLLAMMVGVFLCWIEWAGLNRERSMWMSANELSRMEVEGQIAKAWRSWDSVCFDRGFS